MGYSVKWVAENLGITRDMIRYYEKEKLFSASENRNTSNNYRDFSDDAIEYLWTIKLLIGIGFSAKEIREWRNNPEYSFYDAIKHKVEQLEKRHDEISTYLKFAKTIKMTGRIPSVTKLGAMKFHDFIEYARENWNMYEDPSVASIAAACDILISKHPEELSDNDIDQLVSAWGNIAPDQMVHLQTIGGYFRVLSDMKNFDCSHDTVQTVVRLLYDYMSNLIDDQQSKPPLKWWFVLPLEGVIAGSTPKGALKV